MSVAEAVDRIAHRDLIAFQRVGNLRHDQATAQQPIRDSALPHRPLASLHRVFAVPEAVAETAEGLVRSWRTPTGEYGAEWDQAREVRTAINAFRQSVR
ncbi:hypothetical protein ACFWCA_49960 [Streptomyces phaeochromogenes]|uniref:hypothetical protein n=1 Tax=Streptomyces phaeochromogenes TaxID=1923 RepID=UPI0036C42860